MCLTQGSDLLLSMSHYLRRYREEHGENFDLDISENNLSCLVKLHRALNFCMCVSTLTVTAGDPTGNWGMGRGKGRRGLSRRGKVEEKKTCGSDICPYTLTLQLVGQIFTPLNQRSYMPG